MSHLALYRKYRSQTFGDLVGQGHVVRTLQNAITQGKVAHAYLFTGPRGTGKTSTARLLAKALNCENGPTAEPCNNCDSCRSVTDGSSMDVVEMDAASEAGVDQVREAVVGAAEYLPSSGKYRVFIIDEVHDLSGKAFDALLKTIEEPPAHVVFILATTEYNKVPPTIRSRCQRFEFHRGTIQDVVQRLEYVAKSEGVEFEPPALAAIARMADGGYRDALTLLEQAILTANGSVTLQTVYDQLGLMADDATDKLLMAVAEQDVPAIIGGLDDAYRLGRDPRAVVESLLHRLADLTRAAYSIDTGAFQDSALEAALHASATRIGAPKLLRLRGALAEVHKEIRDISLPRVWLEAELVAASLPQQTVVAAAPQPAAPRQVAASAPVAQARDEEAPAPRPAPKPAAAAAAPKDPALAPFAQAWQEVVAELSGMSRTAAMHLVKSRVKKKEGDVATIEFERRMDADWVRDSNKFRVALNQAWAKRLDPAPELRFVAKGRAAEGLDVERSAVELPIEGAQLEQVGREVFGAEQP